MEEAALNPRRWWTLGVLCLSLLIVTVGNSSLNVVIPTLSRQLDASTSQLQWVVAGYSLVFAGLLFSAGAIGDRFGRKGALQLGLLGFLCGVGLASLSTSMWQLIACRLLMGACAAFIMPSTLSILVNVFPPHERAKAIAVWAGVSGGAGSLGPIASGWLLARFWYGSVFLVNVPIILFALAAGAFLVPTSKDPHEQKLDPVGAVLSIVGIVSLVFGLISAPENGWLAPSTLVAFAVGAVVLFAFVQWERRVAEPMLDMAYFHNPAFSTASAGMILMFLSMFGVMFLITQYFQLILGYSPFSAALRFLPMAPIMMIVAPQTPRIVARFGSNRTVAAGMTLVACGFASFSFLGVNTSYSYVLVCFILLIGGIAMTMSPMTAAIMSAVPPRRAGAGSAMNDATRELGAALGVAVLGSVAASRYSSGIAGVLGRLSPADRTAAKTSLGTAMQAAQHLPPATAMALRDAAEHSFVSGIHWTALTGA
ncbi:MAG TPA: DHA2 family efflux MFS transporter permease subunit, partial [Acidimicrobiales bacterium]|nr:DHA2 family efflux MFS transporter permease subunit [Acidimicrobiales bacterium]